MGASLNQIDPRSGLPIPADFIVDQGVGRYTQMDHHIWRKLFRRQSALLRGRVVDEFHIGLAALGIADETIPEFERLNRRLGSATGWQVIAVPGLVPDDVFFAHLANRRFPAGYWVRSPAALDYIEEPDVFHDVFGHVPLLMQQRYADYMQAYGAAGLRLAGSPDLQRLARLYWYTVEFGLMQTPAGLRIFGAGIVSSAGETIYALEDTRPKRVRFNEVRVMRTDYEIDTFQKIYFVLNGYDDLPALDPDSLDSDLLASALAQAGASGDLAPGEAASDDIIFAAPPMQGRSRSVSRGWRAAATQANSAK